MVLGVISLLVLLGGYTLLSWAKHRENPEDKTIPTWSQLAGGVKQIVSPPPQRSGGLLAAALGETESAQKKEPPMLWRDLKATGARFLVGYGLSVIIGVFLGTLMGSWQGFHAFTILPLRLVSRIIPTAALAVFFVLAGTGLTMYAVMIVFGTLPAIAIGTALEIQSFPTELRYKAYTLGASHFEVIWDSFLPMKAPEILEIIKTNIGPAMVYLLAAELLVANEGFGYTIRVFSRKLDMTVVYPYLLILAAIGFLFDLALRQTQQRLCPWHTR